MENKHPINPIILNSLSANTYDEEFAMISLRDGIHDNVKYIFKGYGNKWNNADTKKQVWYSYE